MLSDREAVCPECGSPLTVGIEKNKRTGELKIVFWCNGDYDDRFRFEILTGLNNVRKGNPTQQGLKLPATVTLTVIAPAVRKGNPTQQVSNALFVTGWNI